MMPPVLGTFNNPQLLYSSKVLEFYFSINVPLGLRRVSEKITSSVELDH